MHLFSTLHKGIDTYLRFFVKKETPVVVLAPGRVGSISLNSSLRASGVFSFKLESTSQDKRGTAQFVLKHVFGKRRPAKVITLVRDPVAMMLTYYMSKANAGWLAEAKQALQNGDLPALRSHFISDVLETDRLRSHLDWFTNDFKAITGIDIYAVPFDTQKMWQVVEHELYPILILRTELDDQQKVALIKKHIAIENLSLSRINTGDTKSYKETYTAFKEQLALPESILNAIYTHKYCQHFFSPEERNVLLDKWSGR